MNHTKNAMEVFKPDWLEARQRMANWWEGKNVDRAVASVTAPVAPRNPSRSAYIPDVPGKYTDFDTVFNNLDYGLERTFWGGEAFPMHFVYAGPMFHQAFLGCEPVFTPSTTWYEPICKNLDELSKVEFDRNNCWWLFWKEMIRRSTERSGGRYLTSIWGIAAIIDSIAGLMGNEEILIAMAEEPERLKGLRDKFATWGKESFDELFELANGRSSGVIDWMGVWCPMKKTCTTQSDLSVMISPEMFREFVLEDLESTYSYVDHGIYHLDGEEQIRHLDILLSIDKLKLIQWVPSDQVGDPGYGDPMNWIDLFKRIQDAGKSVLIYCPPERVSGLLKKIARDKVFLGVSCPDEESAGKVLKDIERAGI